MLPLATHDREHGTRTLAAAGSFAVRLFITRFPSSFEIESLCNTRLESFCVGFFFPNKDLRTALLVGQGDGVHGCQTDQRPGAYKGVDSGEGRIAGSFSETPRPPSCARGVCCRDLAVNKT